LLRKISFDQKFFLRQHGSKPFALFVGFQQRAQCRAKPYSSRFALYILAIDVPLNC